METRSHISSKESTGVICRGHHRLIKHRLKTEPDINAIYTTTATFQNLKFGVDFVSKGKSGYCVTCWTPFYKRLLLQVKSNFYNIIIISAHATTKDVHEELNDFFYEQFLQHYKS